MVIQVYAPNSNAEEPEVELIGLLWRPIIPYRTNTPNRYPFHYMGLECKSRKSRNTWINRQIWPWSTEWSRAKANRGLPRECTGHSRHPLPTTQEKTLHMDITRWSILKLGWLYSLQPKMEKLYAVSKKRPEANCGSDHDSIIAKFSLKLKKVGKATRPFRYDLNQIPYNYHDHIPGGSEWKSSALSTRDPGSTPGSGRSPGEGNGNPLQYSCLEKSHGWRRLVGYSPWDHKESNTAERFHFLFSFLSTIIQWKWQVDSRD